MKKAVFLFCIALVAFSKPLVANSLKNSQTTASYIHIYQITDKEAEKIVVHEEINNPQVLLHSLIDQYPTNTKYTKILPPGHYIRMSIIKNKQSFEYMFVPSYEVFALNNSTDLCLRVYDLKGNQINKADLFIHGTKLKYDSKTEYFYQKKSNAKGILKVVIDGKSSFFKLNRARNNPWVKRAYYKTFYSIPLGYVWIPVKTILNIPVDGVKSLLRNYPVGSIQLFSRFFTPPYSKSRNNIKGYFVFNKPKYMPGDTVKCKAYIVGKNGKAVAGDVDAFIYNGSKRTKIQKVQNYMPGSYSFQFILHDSLKLKLDNYYFISLERNKKSLIRNSFYFEDYILKNIELNLRLPLGEQYAGAKFCVFAKATDDNDLNLQDAKLKIEIVSQQVNRTYDDYLFIPNQIYSSTIPLKTKGETEICIPDSVFPKADFNYLLNATLLTTDNVKVGKTENVKYFYKKESFDFKLDLDSLSINFVRNGKPELKGDVLLYAIDNFGNRNFVDSICTPFKFKVNPYYAKYECMLNDTKFSFDVSAQNVPVQCNSFRNSDSIYISMDNPAKINFVYNIYKRNKELRKGNGEQMSFAEKSNDKDMYYVSVRYLWGGKIKENMYQIPFNKYLLNVELNQPKHIYPGQKVKLTALVTDAKNKPVEGVDLTAFSLTQKFNYAPPTVPFLGKNLHGKEQINNFRFDDVDVDDEIELLNFKYWSKIVGLDTLEYYKFRFPEDGVYQNFYLAKDSITQFSPFVFDKYGQSQNIRVIYVDNKPVYFNWSNNVQPYSFRIGAGEHNIKLRMNTRAIELSNITMVEGCKNIFSISDNFKNDSVISTKSKFELTAFERNILKPYTFPYRNNFNYEFAYIENEGRYERLNSNYYGDNRLFAGPIIGKVHVVVKDKIDQSFDTESGFAYEMEPNVIKMREMRESEYPFDSKRAGYNADDYTDEVVTPYSLGYMYNKYLENKIREYNEYQYGSNWIGNLTLNVNFSKNNSQPRPIAALLLSLTDVGFCRVISSNTYNVSGLEEGIYKLIYYFPDSLYFATNVFEMKKGGINYLNVTTPAILYKDTCKPSVRSQIEKIVFSKKIEKQEWKDVWLANTYSEQYAGEGVMVSGKVMSEDEPVIGATIVIPGTKYGTISNLEGEFKIKVPSGKDQILVSFIGCKPQTVNLTSNQYYSITLDPDTTHLDEVVVIGYGVQQKMTLTGSIVSVLSDRVSGVSVQSNIRIRGAGTVNQENKPLYVIDGEIYDGDLNQINTSNFNNIEILKDADAVALYGSRAANGVVLLTSKNAVSKGKPNDKGADFGDDFIQSVSNAKELRTNFSDYAFWQPRLITNKNGIAEFEVTFPDDITKWNTYVLAMNSKKQSGQAQFSTKSIKPLLAQVSVPAFLVEGDSCVAVGKSINYMPDTTYISTKIEVDGKLSEIAPRKLEDVLVDKFSLKSFSDSIKVKYSLKRTDGYADGEQRNINILKKGMLLTEGDFKILENNDTYVPHFNSQSTEVTLYAHSNALNVLENDIKELKEYSYNCNEQIASKLQALLSEQLIRNYREEKFSGDKQVKDYIKVLIGNMTTNYNWGWWPTTSVNYTFSEHIVAVLAQAKKQGYNVDLDLDKLAMSYIRQLDEMKIPDTNSFLSILKILKTLDCVVDYRFYLGKLNDIKLLTLDQKLKLAEMKQLCEIPFDTTLLQKYRKTTMLGSVYFDDTQTQYSNSNEEIINILTAYRLLRDLNASDSVLSKIRAYFFETKENGYKWNTYQTAQILQTILPDLLKGNGQEKNAEIKISGTKEQLIHQFPFTLKLEATDSIVVTNPGLSPVFITTYQRYWESMPKPKQSYFVISTYFEGKSKTLTAGNSVKLFAEVQVKKDANYVMINVPIPAACTYDAKINANSYNEYREYFKSNTNIYCEKLSVGKHVFEINLLPRFSGTYTLNPAKVELMYFPTFNANNESKQIYVE